MLMKRIAWRIVSTLVVFITSMAVSGSAQAHEKWFQSAALHPTQWSTVLQMPAIAGVGIALAATALVGLWWRVRGRQDLIPGPTVLGATPQGRAGFYALVPLILGIHAGLPLIV